VTRAAPFPAFARLLSQSIEVGPISYPSYMPSGECYVEDPDGWRIQPCHWVEAEHTACLERIGRPDPCDGWTPQVS
jgi:hypothetical protein